MEVSRIVLELIKMMATGKEPPLLMTNCKINPEWEKWLKANHPNISDELTNANIFIKILTMRATIDIVLKQNWDYYSQETLALLQDHPELWDLLQTMDPIKPTMLQRFIRFLIKLLKRNK